MTPAMKSQCGGLDGSRVAFGEELRLASIKIREPAPFNDIFNLQGRIGFYG